MATLITTCPHCAAENIAMKIVGFDWTRSDGDVNAFASCSRCFRPTSFELERTGASVVTQHWFGSPDALQAHIEIIAKSRWRIEATYPPHSETDVPADVPSDVARIYRQAKKSHQRGELDGAGMLYRKALETAVKTLDPDGKGTLDARIRSLTKNDLIPGAVATWGHEIRGIGNDAAHDADEPAPEEVNAAAEFAEAFLIYAFTMPAKIKNRLTKPDEPLPGS